MKTVKKIALLCLSLFIISSCEDFLDQQPEQQVSIDEQMSTKAGVLQAYNGIYRDVEAIFSSKYAVYADALGGNITFSPRLVTDANVIIPQEIEFAYNFNATPQELNFDGYYDDWYGVINQVNIILDRRNEFTFFDSNELDQLQAELLSLRALSHYQLSLLFAQHYGFTPDGSHLGVVYNTRTLVAGEDFPSRPTLAENYALMQDDLDTALNLFNDTQLQSGPDFSYLNATNTRALYARIALQMSDWQTAKDLSAFVIQNSGVSLMPSEGYIQEWEKEELAVSEVLLEFSAPRTTEGDVSSTVAIFFQYSSPSNYGRYVASGDLLNLYTEEDLRKEMFIQENIPTLINGVETNVDYFFTKKFQDNAGTLNMRLSELYLIKAEANARLGLDSEALNDLNTIRQRANLSALTSTENVLDEIFLERRREMALEGHLLFDIARYKRNVVRNLGCISTLCNLSYPSDFLILPIPIDNVLQNENMQQNEGY